MAAIAATTRGIRVGSAGVMLPHYAALKVAEQFRVLEAIAPGRIDLGVGRAPGSDRLTALALNPYAECRRRVSGQVRDLLCWLGRHAVAGRPSVSRDPRAIPRARASPRSGSSAAPTTARSSPRTSDCRTRSPTSSATAAASRRRCIFTARAIVRAPIIRSRKRRSASGRSPPTTKRKRAGSCTRASTGASDSSRGCAARCCRPTRRRRNPIRRQSRASSSVCGRRRSWARPTRSLDACASLRSAWRSTSSSSSRGPTTSRRGCARTSCWPRSSVARAFPRPCPTDAAAPNSSAPALGSFSAAASRCASRVIAPRPRGNQARPATNTIASNTNPDDSETRMPVTKSASATSCTSARHCAGRAGAISAICARGLAPRMISCAICARSVGSFTTARDRVERRAEPRRQDRAHAPRSRRSTRSRAARS